MVLNDPLLWLEILGLFLTILFYIFDKENKRRRGIIGSISLVLLAIFLVTLFRPRPPYNGWVICWHGYLDQNEKQGYEFLAAYPESAVRQGLTLSTTLPKPWSGEGANLLNDSLKSCLYKGKWYGSSDLDWYPSVSYLKLENGYFLVCHDAPGCHGQQWSLYPGASSPDYITEMLREPSGNSIQILNYTKTP
jgi:hypothetical protein